MTNQPEINELNFLVLEARNRFLEKRNEELLTENKVLKEDLESLMTKIEGLVSNESERNQQLKDDLIKLVREYI